MIRYNTKRLWGYSADTKPMTGQIGDRFLEVDSRNEYVFGQYNSWDLIGASGGTGGGTNPTTRYVPYNNSGTFADSNIYYNGTNLGINNSSPSMKLDVSGNTIISHSPASYTENVLTVKNTNSTIFGPATATLALDGVISGYPVDIRLGSTTPTGLRMYAHNYTLSSSPEGAGFQFYSNSDAYYPGQVYFDSGANDNSAIIFRTAKSAETITERMRITVAGRVGIGTSTPSANLHSVGDAIITGDLSASTVSATTYYNLNAVTGGTYSSGTITLAGSGTIGTSITGLISTAVTATTLSSSNLLSVTSNGGSATTTTINAVTGGSYSDGTITLSGTGTISSSIIGLGALTAVTFYSGDGTLSGNRIVNIGTNTLNFSSSTIPDTLVLSGGNIGVGTSSPLYKLDVSGNTRISGDTLINGITAGKGGGDILTNTAFGRNALSSNVTGTLTSAVGSGALTSLTAGTANIAFGHNALTSLIDADYNSAMGQGALNSLTGGTSNSAFGGSALGGLISGVSNIAYGNNAGRYLSDGVTPLTGANTSIFIGTNSRSSVQGTFSNQIVIGATAVGLGGNSTVIGSTSTSKTIIYGNLGLGTTATTNTLHVSASTNPVRFVGLQNSGNTNYIVSDSNGVLSYRSDVLTGSSSISAVTLTNNILSVIPNGGSATTTTINAVTGGTYSDGTITLSGTGTISSSITGLPTFSSMERLIAIGI